MNEVKYTLIYLCCVFENSCAIVNALSRFWFVRRGYLDVVSGIRRENWGDS